MSDYTVIKLYAVLRTLKMYTFYIEVIVNNNLNKIVFKMVYNFRLMQNDEKKEIKKGTIINL